MASTDNKETSAWKDKPFKLVASLFGKEHEKPVEQDNYTANLPEASPEQLSDGLEALVDHSEKHTDLSRGIYAPMSNVMKIPWIHKLIPGIEKLSSAYHIGNFVAIRGTDQQIFESMPIYARIGMHLLFYGKYQTELLHLQRAEKLLRQQTIKQGKIYDSPESAKSIPSFIHAYSLKLDELKNPDPESYTTFNQFFYRELKPDARPVENADNPNGFCSAADSRLTVYQTVDLAKKIWIKGKNFNIPNLLNIAPDSVMAKAFDNASLAIFRLAPADYHRFHSPIDGVVGETGHIPGQYYTVNPQVVNEVGFDVFTANSRTVLYMTHTQSGAPVAFVAIGALLVGSIVFTTGGEKGKTVKRGEELGYFAYGGSTVVVVFPKGMIEFDKDLVENSDKALETLMKVGGSLGRTPATQ